MIKKSFLSLNSNSPQAISAYSDMYELDFKSKDCSKSYNKEKQCILDSLPEKTSYNTSELNGIFESLLFKNNNEFCLETFENEQITPKSLTSTRESANANQNTQATKASNDTIVNGKNGNQFKITNNTITKTNNDGTTRIFSQPGEPSLVIGVKNEDGTESEIVFKFMAYVTQDVIDNCIKLITEMKPSTLKDLVKEQSTIQVGKIPFGTEEVKGRFDPSTNTIYLSYDKNIREVENPNQTRNCITEETLTHELGHALDFKFGHGKGEMYSLKDLFDKIKRDDGKVYAYKNFSEFFAEYYTFKQLGESFNGAGTLFRKLSSSSNKAVKEILSKMDEIIENTRKLSAEERNPLKMNPAL